MRALMEDIATNELRTIVRQEVKAELEKLGVMVNSPEPSKKPDLRVVKNGGDDGGDGSAPD